MSRTDTKKKSSDILVFWTRKDAVCDECETELFSGAFIQLIEGKAYCLECADLDHLVFLPRGDTALTRRASKHSKLRAVVVRWSTARKRYERQGILVEEEALDRAEEECAADAEARQERRERSEEYRERLDRSFIEDFARAVRERYPRCPENEEQRIAEHACRKYSGRVGRSAAAKNFDPEMIDLAVRAHVRHEHTDYDDYLMQGWDRHEARAELREEVDEVLERWQRD